MAERFARGGRLIAFGRSPAARSDARHVAVEFVHPVIVGKRALPALGLTGDGGDARRARSLLARARRHRDRASASRGRRRAGARSRAARARGCLTIAFAPVGAEWEFEPPSADPSSARSWSRRSTTCCGSSCTCSSSTAACSTGRTERRAHDAGASSFLYPFLAEREHDLDAVLDDVRALGADEGRRGRRAARADADARTPTALAAAAAALRACFDARRHAARARQRRLGDRRDGRRRRLPLGRPGAPPAIDLTEDPRSSPRSPTTSAPRRSSRAR